MYAIKAPFPLNSQRIDADACVVKTVGLWTSEDRALSGLPPDRILTQILAPLVDAGGAMTVVSSREEGAVNPERRKRVVAEMLKWAGEEIAFFKTLPQVAANPVVAKPHPANPPKICTAVSSNAEIAKSLVKRAAWDAKDLGEPLVGGHVGACFTLYVQDNKLSEKRAASIAQQLAGLGYTW